MTIQAEGNTLYVRCGSGDGDVIEIHRAPDDDMISISLWFDVTSPIGVFVEEKYGPIVEDIPFISLPRAEALALGHMLIDMATRPVSPHDDPSAKVC
jgi:hypothetical protein